MNQVSVCLSVYLSNDKFKKILFFNHFFRHFIDGWRTIVMEKSLNGTKLRRAEPEQERCAGKVPKE